MATETSGNVHVVDVGVDPDDGVLVKGVVVVETCPRAVHLQDGTEVNANLVYCTCRPTQGKVNSDRRFIDLPSVSQRQEHDLPNGAKPSPQKTGSPPPGYWYQAPPPEDTHGKYPLAPSSKFSSRSRKKKHCSEQTSFGDAPVM